MSKEKVIDLYAQIPSRDSVLQYPKEGLNSTERMLLENPVLFMGGFDILGFNRTGNKSSNDLVDRVGSDPSIVDFPQDLRESGINVETEVKPKPDFLEGVPHTVLTSGTFSEWYQQAINGKGDEKVPLGILYYFSEIYQYRGDQIDRLLNDISSNQISMLALTWVVNHPDFGCAQRVSNTNLDTGLTPVGKDLIDKIFKLDQPMIVDLAHLSLNSIKDILDMAEKLAADGQLAHKGIIFSHGGIRDIYPGKDTVADSQNITADLLIRLGILGRNIPVLAQVMQWKGTYAAQENWQGMTPKNFYELELRHIDTIKQCGVPVAVTSDWTLNPHYRDQFITPDGPYGLFALRGFLKEERDDVFAEEVIRLNALNFLRKIFLGDNPQRSGNIGLTA